MILLSGIRQITLKQEATLLCLIGKATTPPFVDRIDCSDGRTETTKSCPWLDKAGETNITIDSSTTTDTTTTTVTPPSYILECAAAESKANTGSYIKVQNHGFISYPCCDLFPHFHLQLLTRQDSPVGDRPPLY